MPGSSGRAQMGGKADGPTAPTRYREDRAAGADEHREAVARMTEAGAKMLSELSVLGSDALACGLGLLPVVAAITVGLLLIGEIAGSLERRFRRRAARNGVRATPERGLAARRAA